jgi:protein tyrosine phosphatase
MLDCDGLKSYLRPAASEGGGEGAPAHAQAAHIRAAAASPRPRMAARRVAAVTCALFPPELSARRAQARVAQSPGAAILGQSISGKSRQPPVAAPMAAGAQLTFPSNVKISELHEYFLGSYLRNPNDPDSMRWQMKKVEESPEYDGEMMSYEDMPAVVQDRNRYTNILPSRLGCVVLSTSNSLPERFKGYVNASFFPSRERPEYIMAQAPPVEAFEDFWRTVWEFEVPAILMLTPLVERGRLKADQYWPDEKSSLRLGHFELFCSEDKQTPLFRRRKIQLRDTQSSEVREVEHWQVMSWADHGVPGELEQFEKLLQEWRDLQRRTRDARGQDKPAVYLVHCSAGVGRTGTFITLDNLLHKLARDPKQPFNVLREIYALRQLRPGSIQTADQYEFVFEFLSYAIHKGAFGVERHERPADFAARLEQGRKNLAAQEERERAQAQLANRAQAQLANRAMQAAAAAAAQQRPPQPPAAAAVAPPRASQPPVAATQAEQPLPDATAMARSNLVHIERDRLPHAQQQQQQRQASTQPQAAQQPQPQPQPQPQRQASTQPQAPQPPPPPPQPPPPPPQRQGAAPPAQPPVARK